MRKLLDPSNNSRLQPMRNGVVINPLVCIRLAYSYKRHPIPSVGLKHVAHIVRCKVSRTEHDGTLGQVGITDAVLQHKSQQHILDRLHSLTNLIEHDDDRLV